MGFFDKVNDISKNIGKKATETYKTVSDKSGKILEETKTRIRIASKKSDIDELYCILGKKVFEIYEKGQDSKEYSEECERISEIKKEIIVMEEKIKGLKGVRICKSCNKEIKGIYEFCPICGAKQDELKDEDIIEKEEEQEEKEKSCKKCNEKVPENAIYCPFCGEEID